MTDSMIPEVWQHPEGGVVWVRVDPYDSLPYRVVRPDGTVAWAGGVPVDAAVRMVPETIADAMRGLHDSAEADLGPAARVGQTMEEGLPRRPTGSLSDFALWLHAESLWLRDIADDDRDAAVERAEKAETEVRDAPPRPLDPTNPDDLRAVEVFLGGCVTNYDTVLLLPLRQREVAYEAIQETRRHLDMTADWVAREALRARKIDPQ